MRSKKQPGFLWLFEDLLADDTRAALGEAAERAGLAHAFPGTGMAGDLLPIPEPHHPDLTFERVITDERSAGRTVVLTTHDVSQALAADWAILMAGRVIAFGPPLEALSPENLALPACER